MKNLFIQTLLSFGLAAAGCTNLLAQSTTTHFNVPFDFTAGRLILPAGDYMVTSMSSGSVLAFQQTGGRYFELVSARPASGSQATNTGIATFHRYGGRYFLAAIVRSGGGGWEFAQTKGEKALAQSTPKMPVTVATARTK